MAGDWWLAVLGGWWSVLDRLVPGADNRRAVSCALFPGSYGARFVHFCAVRSREGQTKKGRTVIALLTLTTVAWEQT